jgi:hypothetical protein
MKDSAIFSAAGGMSLIARTVFDVSGTFTPNAKTKLVRAICMGGGSGGVAAWDPYGGYFQTECLPGLGGFRDWEDFAISALPATVTVTVGAGGAAGYRGPDLGGYSSMYPPTAGGNSSFGNFLVGFGAQLASEPSYTPYSSNTRITGNTAHQFVGSRRVLFSPIMNTSEGPSSGNQFTIPEGIGPFYQYSATNSNMEVYMANSWGGNRGGVGRCYLQNGAWDLGAGRCFPDPLATPFLIHRNATAPAAGNKTNAAGPAGIGDYPGGGGAGGGAVNGKGGFPSGGGAGDNGSGAGAGAGGRVIVYEWG